MYRLTREQESGPRCLLEVFGKSVPQLTEYTQQLSTKLFAVIESSFPGLFPYNLLTRLVDKLKSWVIQARSPFFQTLLAPRE